MKDVYVFLCKLHKKVVRYPKKHFIVYADKKSAGGK